MGFDGMLYSYLLLNQDSKVSKVLDFSYWELINVIIFRMLPIKNICSSV